MGRLVPVDPDRPGLDPDIRAVMLGPSVLGTPGVLNVVATLADHPAALRSVWALSAAGRASAAITEDYRELAYLTATLTNNCHY